VNHVNHYLRGSIALGLAVGVVAAPLYGEDQPHAEFLSVSPTLTLTANLAVSGGQISNSTSQMVTYHAASVNLEQLLPHNRLVTQDIALVTPPVDRFNTILPRTGSDPFLQRRQRPSRLEVSAPKLPSFWCDSYQKFRGRRDV
jgi:hypothetical protein